MFLCSISTVVKKMNKYFLIKECDFIENEGKYVLANKAHPIPPKKEIIWLKRKVDSQYNQ